MANYHINPRTGAVGVCRARNYCPFGDAEEHFRNQARARQYYEDLNKSVHTISLTHEHLSALRRNGDFIEEPGDEALMYKLETEEDNRASGKPHRLTFSVIELDRIVAIADEKLARFNSEDVLDRYTRGVVTRISTMRSRIEKQVSAARVEIRLDRVS